jgi:hypothetical protein
LPLPSFSVTKRQAPPLFTAPITAAYQKFTISYSEHLLVNYSHHAHAHYLSFFYTTPAASGELSITKRHIPAASTASGGSSNPHGSRLGRLIDTAVTITILL